MVFIIIAPAKSKIETNGSPLATEPKQPLEVVELSPLAEPSEASEPVSEPVWELVSEPVSELVSEPVSEPLSISLELSLSVFFLTESNFATRVTFSVTTSVSKFHSVSPLYQPLKV